MGKFYAVKNGRKKGIFESWEDCKKQVSGFPNAIYKSFPTYQEANDFIKGSNSENKPISKNRESDLVAYIDGSYDDYQKFFSYAGLILKNGEEVHSFVYADNDPAIIEQRNVAGEIKAAMYVIDYALKQEVKVLDIYYDYAGIENWAEKTWKAKNDFTKAYVDFIDKVKSSLDINFYKVKSHSGNNLNDAVDLLAKKALEKPLENLLDNEITGINEDLAYNKFFGKVKGVKTNPNINFLYNNEVINSEIIFKAFKKKWKSSGKNLKDINEVKILIDLKREIIIIECNYENLAKYIEIELKELSIDG